MAEIIPDTASSTEVVQKGASITRLCFGGLILQMLVYVLKVCTIASRSMLNELLPAVSIAETSLANAFEDVVFSLDGRHWDISFREAVHEFLAAAKSCKGSALLSGMDDRLLTLFDDCTTVGLFAFGLRHHDLYIGAGFD